MGTWTDKKIEKLKVLWEKGVSTAEIGKRLDFSKNAIVGKVHRLGLSNRNSPIKNAPTRIEKVKKIPSRIPQKTKNEELISKGKKSKISANKLQSLRFETKEKITSKPDVSKFSIAKNKKIPTNGVTLNELTPDRCCWPIDDGNSDAFCFCGKKVFKNKPYCLEHCVMAYTTSSSSSSRNSSTETGEKKKG